MLGKPLSGGAREWTTRRVRNRRVRGGAKEWSASCECRLIAMRAATRVTAWHGRSRIRIDYIDDMRIYKRPRTCRVSAVNEIAKGKGRGGERERKRGA